MLREAAQHLQTETSIEKIYFVLFDEEACEVFERGWKRLQADLKKAQHKRESAEASGA